MKILKFARFPAIEFQYNGLRPKSNKNFATFLWITGLILQIVTTLTSAYSTFNNFVDRLFIYKIKVNLIVKYFKKKSFISQKYSKITGQPPTISYMLAFGLKLILQIVFQTIFLFMILWMTLIHKRWENLRYFISREYSQESVVFISGSLILLFFILITLGKGVKVIKLCGY